MEIGRVFLRRIFRGVCVLRVRPLESEVIFVQATMVSVYCWSGDSTHKYFVFVIGQLVTQM